MSRSATSADGPPLASEPSATAPCQLLDWDTRFFGFRIGRVTAGRLTAAMTVAIDRWCDERAVGMLYLLAEHEDEDTHRLAADSGFRRIDERVTLAVSIAHPPDPAPERRVRRWRETDLPGLASIARASHHGTRFYKDPRFPRERCDALYATWIEQSCREMTAEVFVAVEDDDVPVGYVTCHRSEGDTGEIGLVAVAASVSGRGRGASLVRQALAWVADAGARRVTVVTQGENEAALALYGKHGFVVTTRQIWFHRWRPVGQASPA